MRKRFLAIATIPPGWAREDLMAHLERVAQVASGRGVHPLETFYSLQRGRAYTLVDAPSERDVAEVCAAADLPVEVVPGERVQTDLLDEPRRAR